MFKISSKNIHNIYIIIRFYGLASRRPKSWPYNVFALLALAVARDFVTPNYPHGTTSPGGSNHPPGRAENGCSDAFVALVVLVGVVANFSFGGWSVFCMSLERLRSGSWRWSAFSLGIGVGFLFAQAIGQNHSSTASLSAWTYLKENRVNCQQIFCCLHAQNTTIDTTAEQTGQPRARWPPFLHEQICKKTA